MRATTLTYRTATTDDVDRLIQLALVSYGQYKDEIPVEEWQHMKENIENRDSYYRLLDLSTGFVCTDGDTIAGAAYIVLSGNPTELFDADWSYLRMVSVDPAYAGNGIAKRLTQLCIDHARANGEKTIALHTSENMQAARHVYEKLGFTKTKKLGISYGMQYWLYLMKL